MSGQPPPEHKRLSLLRRQILTRRFCDVFAPFLVVFPFPSASRLPPPSDETAKLSTSVRFGGVGDIQANLVRAEKSQLMGRDGEGASLLMHAAQRGETEVFRVVLEFLAEKLSPQEASSSPSKGLVHYCCVDQLRARSLRSVL